MKKKYPVKITPCPIVECKIDIFCKFRVPDIVAIGLIYNALNNLYDGNLEMSSLPVLNIPENIRKKDPNLMNQATNSIKCRQDGDIQIGSYGYSFNLRLPYAGWTVHREFLDKVNEAIHKIDIIENIVNVNLRYLDFFQSKIFEKINLKINFVGRTFNAQNSIYKTQLIEDDIKHILQITQGVHIENKELDLKASGSLIDLTTQVENPGKTEIMSSLDRCHQKNKNLFFDLLQDDFIETLNPVYE